MTVVYLNPDEQTKAELQQGVVEALEDLLAMAKEGKLVSLVGCGHLEDGDIMTVGVGIWNWKLYETIGMLETMKTTCMVTFEENLAEQIRKVSE